jgi:hypothetical protein
VDTKKVLSGIREQAVFNTLPFLIFSVFGAPANCIIAWRVHRSKSDAQLKGPFEPLSLVQGIRVSLLVLVASHSC